MAHFTSPHRQGEVESAISNLPQEHSTFADRLGELETLNSNSPKGHSAFSDMSAARKYCVYVIELRKKVFTENWRFRAANPQFNGVLECLYVGMTSKTPKERFEQHIKGARSQKGHKLSSNIV